ncbi:hypothetical protein VNO80_06643 [Phaseolus coccineus]|uniref:Uncharacterized protein n=1 Tax=Phaseolus coccineus TaxID=3886 RepID=A0AAN9NH75_PHACN
MNIWNPWYCVESSVRLHFDFPEGRNFRQKSLDYNSRSEKTSSASFSSFSSFTSSKRRFNTYMQTILKNVCSRHDILHNGVVLSLQVVKGTVETIFLGNNQYSISYNNSSTNSVGIVEPCGVVSCKLVAQARAHEDVIVARWQRTPHGVSRHVCVLGVDLCVPHLVRFQIDKGV